MMINNMKKYSKIGQFKDACNNVKRNINYHQMEGDYKEGDATHLFTGTCKLHGSNGGMHYNLKTNIITPQSRERALPIDKIKAGEESDNHGFALYVSNNYPELQSLFSEFCIYFGLKDITVYGEWCGGSIQKTVALNQIKDKVFVLFDIAIHDLDYIPDPDKDGDTGDVYMDSDTVSNLCLPEINLYNIHNIKSGDCLTKFNVEINFNDQQSINDAIEKMTKYTIQVEDRCPFTYNEFGVSGIGEGIVWKSKKDRTLFFKTKGEKHSNSKTVGTPKISKDPIMVTAVEEFIAIVVTEGRIQQAIDFVKQDEGLEFLEMKNFGSIIKWTFKDISDEEGDSKILCDEKSLKQFKGALPKAIVPIYQKLY
jgi:hypothetical protein